MLLTFVRGIHQGPVNSPHKWPVTWKMFPFDDVIMFGSFTDYISIIETEVHWQSCHQGTEIHTQPEAAKYIF